MRIEGLSKNARLDLRHTSPKPYVEPSPENVKCWIYRCMVKEGGCNRLVTEWELKKHGGCPYCGTNYVLSTKLRGFREWFPLWLAWLFHHSRYWGPEGWGWWKPVRGKRDRGHELEANV